MGSTRLPGKVLSIVDEQNTSLYFTINQLESCKLIDRIVIATTDNDEDDVIEEFCEKHEIECFRGDTDDVLARYYNCAKKFSFSEILRVTGDCPLIDPNIVDQGISIFKKNILSPSQLC